MSEKMEQIEFLSPVVAPSFDLKNSFLKYRNWEVSKMYYVDQKYSFDPCIGFPTGSMEYIDLKEGNVNFFVISGNFVLTPNIVDPQADGEEYDKIYLTYIACQIVSRSGGQQNCGIIQSAHNLRFASGSQDELINYLKSHNLITEENDTVLSELEPIGDKLAYKLSCRVDKLNQQPDGYVYARKKLDKTIVRLGTTKISDWLSEPFDFHVDANIINNQIEFSNYVLDISIINLPQKIGNYVRGLGADFKDSGDTSGQPSIEQGLSPADFKQDSKYNIFQKEE